MKPSEFVVRVLWERAVADDVKCIRVSKPEGFSFETGQYVSVSVETDEGKIRTPYSIASSPDDDYIELCVKRVEGGQASNYLFGLKVGDELGIFGAVGKFCVDSADEDMVFVCTGTGVAPFVSMIKRVLADGCGKEIILIKGFRDSDGVLYDDEFSDLKEEYDNFEFYNVLSSDGSYVQDCLSDFVDDFSDKDFYLCGLSAMVDAVRERLIGLGVSGDRIFFEKYD